MNFEFLYVYIKAVISNDGKYAMNVVDSLNYCLKDFLEKIQDNFEIELDGNLDAFDLFCLCVSKDKQENLKDSLLKDVLNQLYSCLEKQEEIDAHSNMYEQYINIYVRYLINNGLSPLIFPIETEDLIIYLLIGSKEYLQEPPSKIMEILDTWCELEKPVLFGKQILTQPFFYQNLTNRKTLDIVSSHNDNNLYLLLEGNIKVKLDYSSVSTLDYYDNSTFNVTDIQRILYNPIYCFAYTFKPEIVFLDWFDVYLYVMALLDVDIDDLEKLKASYIEFLDFIDRHICEKVYADKAIIGEECFFGALKIHIKNIREFIRRKRRNQYFKELYIKH